MGKKIEEMCIQTQAQFKLKHKPHIGIINRFVAETMSKTKRNTTAKIAKKRREKIETKREKKVHLYGIWLESTK